MLPNPEAIADLGLSVIVTPAGDSSLPECHSPLEGKTRVSIRMVSPDCVPADYTFTVGPQTTNFCQSVRYHTYCRYVCTHGQPH